MLIRPSLKAYISWSSKIGPIEVLNDNLLLLLLCEPWAYSITYIISQILLQTSSIYSYNLFLEHILCPQDHKPWLS